MMQPITLDDIAPQLYEIVQTYTHTFADYSASPSEIDPYLAPVLDWIVLIMDSMATDPESADYVQYEQTTAALDSLNGFLALMNQPMDEIFDETPLGVLCSWAADWCSVATARRSTALEDVWEWLAPEVPDTIDVLSTDEEPTEPSREAWYSEEDLSAFNNP